MPRKPRIQFEGMLVHVTTRGNRKGDIYLDNQDRIVFNTILADVCEGCDWKSFSHCQMRNHNHLGLYVPKGNLSIGMQKLNGDYAKYFNEKYGFLGRVYQRRYDSKIIDSERYFLEVCRYIALNPVKDGFVEHSVDWPWGSYREIVGLDPEPGFLDRFWILSHFGNNEDEAMQNYIEHIEIGRQILKEKNYPQNRCQAPILGIK